MMGTEEGSRSTTRNVDVGVDVDVPSRGPPGFFMHTKRERINRVDRKLYMFWLIILFVVMICYWMWVQQDEQRRVDEAVSRRKDDWKREQEDDQRAKEKAEKRKQIERVQKRLTKVD